MRKNPQSPDRWLRDPRNNHVGLAELIKAIALEMNSDKEEIQYESIKDEESDVGAVRDVYYKMVPSWYGNGKVIKHIDMRKYEVL